MKKAIILLAFGLLALAQTASATTYYVRTDGHNTNCDGTVDAPDDGVGGVTACAWLTLQKGLDGPTGAGPHTVLVQPGTYATQMVVDTDNNGREVTIEGNGGTINAAVAAGFPLDVTNTGVASTTVIHFKNITLLSTVPTSAIVRVVGNPILSFEDSQIGASTAVSYIGFNYTGSDATTGRKLTLTNSTITVGNNAIITGYMDELYISGGAINWGGVGTSGGIVMANVRVNYVTVDGVTFTGGAGVTGGTIAMSTASSTRLIVTDNTFNVAGMAVYANYSGTSGINNILIDNNRIIATGATSNAGACLVLGNDDVNSSPSGVNGAIEITRNFCDRTNGQNHALFIGEGMTGARISGNTVTGGDYQLVLKADKTDTSNNLVYANGNSGGITVKGAKNNFIHHNSVYSINNYALTFQQQPNIGAGTVNSEGNIIKDNIFVLATSTVTTNPVVNDSDSNHANNRIDRNVYWASGGATRLADYNSTVITTLAGMKAAWDNWTETTALNGVVYGRAWPDNDENSIVADPQFISTDPYSSDFLRTAAFSPAKGTKNTGAPDLSVWNDKGAWQTNGSSGTSGRAQNRTGNR